MEFLYLPTIQMARIPRGSVEARLAGRILVVDDDAAVREMLARFLRSHGYDIAEARGAFQARKLMDGTAFDLLILDVVMPGESGLELADALLAGPAPPPIILISGYASEEPASFALKHHKVTFVSKPFGPEALLSMVEGMLARRPV